MQLKREHQFSLWYFILAFLAIIWIQGWIASQSAVKSIPYSEFQQLLAQGKLADVVVGPQQITGKLKDAAAKQPNRFVTEQVAARARQDTHRRQGDVHRPARSGIAGAALSWLLPTAGFFLIWFLMMRRMAGARAVASAAG